MAFDDPIVWVLIVAVVIFLFGANKIPQLAKSIGQAKREFDTASREIKNPSPEPSSQQPVMSTSPAIQNSTTTPSTVAKTQDTDALIVAATKEGIDTKDKTRDQIATELAWKLKNS